jgi:hypothetical protein
MKTLLYALSSLLLVLCGAQTLLATPQIKLSGRKSLVLSLESRATVLEVANHYLSDKDESFLALVSEVETPYAFEQPVVLQSEAEVEAPKAFNYDDASILSVVAKSFELQVRGSLARGDAHFLQLRGGNLIKVGSSFPASIPQADNQTFTVTVTEISSDGYVLQLGEATQTVLMNAPGTGRGAVRTDSQ